MAWRPCYCAPTVPEAHVVKGFLEDRGVPCLLRTEGASMYPLPILGSGIDVLVPDHWLPVAQKLVARRRRSAARVVPLRARRVRG